MMRRLEHEYLPILTLERGDAEASCCVSEAPIAKDFSEYPFEGVAIVTIPEQPGTLLQPTTPRTDSADAGRWKDLFPSIPIEIAKY